MNFEQHVQLSYDNLSDSEKNMVSYLREHRQEIGEMTIVELGSRLLSSKSSVLRLAKKLGFRGYSDMKYSIEESLQQLAIAPQDLVANLKDEINKTFQYAEQTNFQPLLDKIKNARNVVLYATGFTQNNYTKDFANDLFISGRPNFLISGETNFDMIAHTLNEEDLVIITSLSGNTSTIKNTIKLLKLNQVALCGVTAFGKNYLGDHADYHLYYEVSTLPSNIVEGATSMVCLNIILSILSRKYREFVLFDE